ncbi:MAG TPA: FAD-dependent oxidoreductase, partial [Acetobacteraceae bacterium]|nr:FAD-dependent oxidoreductase [Acetobacteraceae bacterium]
AALRRAMERRGGRFQPGAAELLAEAGRVGSVRVGAEIWAADCVVLAAGAWAPALLAPLGIALAVAPQRGQITHLRLEGARTDAWPIVLPPGSHYLLAFEAGRVVVGATRETGSGFDLRVTAGGQAEVLNQALTIAPGLAPATLLETRVGFRPVGPDIRPMLGRSALGGLVIGNGLGPTGLTMGPYAGRLLAQLALGGEPEMGLSPYDPGRTEAGTE